MNQLTSFRYTHIDRTQAPRDVRKNHALEIEREHCYFVGFRVSSENVMHYQHALILADDYKSLVDGINDERDSILEKGLAVSVKDIELVFIRSLVMHDTTMIKYIDSHGIQTEIQKALSKRDDYQFTVFGLLGEEQPYLLHENTNDALMAMRLARLHSIKYAVKEFKPLDVRQAHPVTRELDAKFHQVADRFMKLVSSSYESGYLH